MVEAEAVVGRSIVYCYPDYEGDKGGYGVR